MKRVGYGVLFLLVGVLFPVLIWVALFAAIREPLLQAMRRVASAILALLAGIFFPLLIWVGLVVALRQWVRERIFQREPGHTVAEILAAARLPIQWAPTADESVAAAVFLKHPMSEIQELLARAELEAIRQEPAPTIGKMLQAAKLPPEEESPKGKTVAAEE